jgi:hypothetical protein
MRNVRRTGSTVPDRRLRALEVDFSNEKLRMANFIIDLSRLLYFRGRLVQCPRALQRHPLDGAVKINVDMPMINEEMIAVQRSETVMTPGGRRWRVLPSKTTSPPSP